MLTHCSEKTNGACFEEIAMVSFGKKAQGFTSVCMILCNGGFVISYIVLVSLKHILLYFLVQIFYAFFTADCYWQSVTKMV